MDGCLPNLIKYLLFATNFLVFLMALIVCGFGIFALVDVKQLTELVDAVDKDSGFGIIRTGAVILVIVSAIIVLVTFFGCCGALKENRCMLGTYFTIILGLFIIMIVGAVLGVSKSLDELDKPLLSSIEKYDPNSESNDIKAIVKGWDNVQKDFKCCGVNSYQDWTKNTVIARGSVPVSCCQSKDIKDEDREKCATNPDSYSDYLPGCMKKLEDYIDNNSSKIIGVAVAVAVIMFLNMIFAFALCTMTN